MKRWIVRIAVAIVALALVLAGVVAWVVPSIATSKAEKGFEQATGRKLAIGGLSIHPFTWRVEVRDFTMSEIGGEGTFASFKRAEVVFGLSSVWKGAPVVSRVRLERPHFDVVRTGPNTYNFSDLVKYLLIPVPAVSLNDVAITGGSIDFHDRALPKEEHHTVRDASLIVPFLTTLASQVSEYGNGRFSAVVDGAPLVVDVKVRGLPRAAEVSARIDLRDLSLPVYLSYLPAGIPVRVVSGKVAVTGTASYRVSQDVAGVAGWEGAVSVTDMKVSEHGGQAHLAVESVTVKSRVTTSEPRGLLLDDGSIEIRKVALPFGGEDHLSVDLLTVQGVKFTERENALEIASVLLQDGSARLSRNRRGALSPEVALDGLLGKVARSRPAAPAPALHYRIGRVEGKGIDVLFTDGARKELPSFSMTGAHFVAQDVTGPVPGKIPFEFGANLGKDASLGGSGWVVPAPLALDAVMNVRGVGLSAVAPYVDEEAQVVVAGGRLDATLAAALETRKDRLTGTFRGSTALRGVEVLDRGRGKLLAWDVLALDGIQGTLGPLRLRVAKVDLSGLRASLVVDEDGNSNIPAGKVSDKKGTRPAGPAPRAPFAEIRIDDFHLGRGTIDFTDRSVPGDFKARLRDVDVRITGMTTEPGKAADLKARLVMPKGAPLTVSGKAALLREPAFADVGLVLEGLDLTTATPYAAAFLGLEIDKGSLTVKSQAKVESGSIAAENRIRVDQLTYGKPVKSDKATILPVKLLTDVLRDGNGDIVLTLPISAQTDDENLVGTIVAQAATKVVFPPGSPLRSIPFDGCSADLTADAQGRLRKLAEALEERQAMKIVAVGYADRADDEKGCVARAAAERAAASPAVTTAASSPPAAPAPPSILSLEGEGRLQAIARARAEAVRAYLVDQGRVDPGRVSARIGNLDAAPAKKGDALPRVEFTDAGD